MNREPLTPLQQSAATTGRRFFRLSEEVYAVLCSEIDQRRGFPAGEGTRAPTIRGLPLPEKCKRAENGDVLISVETWRIESADEEMLDSAKEVNLVTELTWEEFSSQVVVPTGLR